MGSKLFPTVTERPTRPTTFGTLLTRLGFGAFAAPDRKVSAVVANSGGKFTDSLERELDLRSRDLW